MPLQENPLTWWYICVNNVAYPIQKIYKWATQVRPASWPTPPPWTPSATCVAYYPLEDDFKDYSWHGYDLTNSWMVLGTTSDGYKAGQLGVNKYAYTTAFDFILTNSTPRTIAFWEWCSSITIGSWSMASILKGYTSQDAFCLWATTYDYPTWGLGNPRWQNIGWRATIQPVDYNMSLIDANQMHSYVFAVDSSWASWYKDGVLIGTSSSDYNANASWFCIWNNQNSDASRNLDWYIRQVVIDTSKWTLSDVQAYHNWTA